MRKISLTTKSFCKLLSHFFLIRLNFEKEITLIKNDKILSGDDKFAKTLNNFIPNTVNNLDIREHKVNDTLQQSIGNHPILKMQETPWRHIHLTLFSSG